MKDNKPKAEEVVIEVMRHFGFRRNYQVAEYFDVTPQTLSGWIKSGEIPPKHLIKYTTEVLNSDNEEKTLSNIESSNARIIPDGDQLDQSNKFSWNKTKLIIKGNIKIN